ncbi:hypothetical protein [Ureibacillus aquaedulcis]|uniref:Uncharacterized protein n=1 Tax=Ureibacillus aquaedulcis TaxID=3058421 RepID=A0ABT8GN64_9BACL|nr:hypothetical protein [Ureibacillus sp. BA0131]MDN4492852.1 hypothetical protein [Ureibacillus sp. BA0131]
MSWMLNNNICPLVVDHYLFNQLNHPKCFRQTYASLMKAHLKE